MFNCQINVNLSITCSKPCSAAHISPIAQAPSFENMGSLVTGTIVLDDFAFDDDFEDFSKDELDETTYQDDDCNDSNRKNKTQYRSGASLE